MAGLPVQFYGAESVIMAATNLNCPAWAVFWGGRNLFSKYEGNDMDESLRQLDSTLHLLGDTASSARYMIKFFEPENGRAIKINEKTTCTAGSFTFVLTDSEEREMKLLGRSSQFGVIGAMQKEIESLKQLLTEEQDDQPQSIGAAVVDMLQNPSKLIELINAGRMLMGIPVQQMPGQSIGAIPASVEVSKEDSLTRLGNAIDTLEQNDPKLVDHLEKLATMAKTDPDKFRQTVSLLDLKI